MCDLICATGWLTHMCNLIRATYQDISSVTHNPPRRFTHMCNLTCVTWLRKLPGGNWQHTHTHHKPTHHTHTTPTSPAPASHPTHHPGSILGPPLSPACVPQKLVFSQCLCHSRNAEWVWTGISGLMRMLYVAVCCSVLQCAAVCCSVLQCVAVSCSVLQCVAVSCRVLQCVAVCCSVLQCVAVCCSGLRCVAVWFSVLQCVAVWCSVLHYVAVCCSG